MRDTLLAIILTLLCGCTAAVKPSYVMEPTPPPLQPAKQQAPTFSDLRLMFNARISQFSTIWARADYRVSWVEDKTTHTMDGDGFALVVLPNRVALMIGKLGETVRYYGSDDECCWAINKEGKQAIIVRRDNVGVSGCDDIPMDVLTYEYLILVGLSQISPNGEIAEYTENRNGDPQYHLSAYVLVNKSPAIEHRYYLDRNTLLLKRVEVVNTSKQNIIARADLDEYVRLLDKPSSFPSKDAPWVPSKIDITSEIPLGEVVITLKQAAIHSPAGDIDNEVFDFGRISRNWHIEKINVLDHNCAHPARLPEEIPVPTTQSSEPPAAPHN